MISIAVGEKREKHEDLENNRNNTPAQLPAAPDGGLHAWLKVLGGFLVYINIWWASH